MASENSIENEALLNISERQSATVVTLGQRALAGIPLSELMGDTVAMVAATLGLEYSAVLQLSPNGRELLVRAGVGWQPDIVGQMQIAADGNSQAGYTLLTKMPVAVHDQEQETRFEDSPLLAQHGVKSGITVLVPHSKQAYGVLGAFSRQQRVYTQADINFLQSVANLLATAIERKEREEQLQLHLVQLESIYRLSDTVHCAHEIEEVYEQAMDALRDTLGVERSAMILYDEAGCGRFVAWRGISEQYRNNPFLHRDNIKLLSTEQDPQPLLMSDVEAAPLPEAMLPLLRQEDIRALGLIPLVSHGEQIGRFGLYYDQPHEFSEDEVQLARTIAGHVTSALQRRRSEGRLRRSESFNRAILTSLAAHIAVINNDGTIVAVNEAWQRFRREKSSEQASCGIGAAEVGENYLASCYGDTNSSAARQGICTVLSGEMEYFTMEYPCHSPAAKRWFMMQVTPLHGLDETMQDSGKAHGAVISHTDITERKQAEERSLQLADHIRLLLESTGEGIYGVDLHGRCSFMNRAAAALIGYGPEEVLGEVIHDVVHHHYADGTPYPTDACPIWHSFQSGAGCRVDNEVYWRRDGTSFAVEYSSFPIFENGVVQGAVVVFSDITERKRAEAERKRAEAERTELLRQAQEANRAKDEFLAVVSHELRTPLNSILGWNALLRSGRLDGETRQHALDAIDNSARSQSQLINDLLDVSRSITGKMYLKLQSVSMAKIVQIAVESENIAADQKSVSLVMNLQPDLPPIIADPMRLQQILWNLLSNALKFTPAGGVVEITATATATHGVLCVHDSGRGISPEFLPYIFDRFRQADSTDTREFGGLGLGLAIVRHLVEAQEGRISVSSQGEGQGATFVVELPRAWIKWPREKPTELEREA